MKKLLLLFSFLLILCGCESVSSSLKEVHEKEIVTDTAISETKAEAKTSTDEATDLVSKAKQTGDKELVDATLKHVETTKRVEAKLEEVSKAHDEEKEALAKADTKVAALETHDEAMTKKAHSASWKLFIAYTIAFICAGLLVWAIIELFKVRILHL